MSDEIKTCPAEYVFTRYCTYGSGEFIALPSIEEALRLTPSPIKDTLILTSDGRLFRDAQDFKLYDSANEILRKRALDKLTDDDKTLLGLVPEAQA